MMNYDNDDNMVPVDSPEAKGGKVHDGHKMVMHQLKNLQQNAEQLLQHLSGCSTEHLQEEWIKKKITLATDYLDSARDYVFSSHDEDGHHDEGNDKPHKDDGFLVVVEKKMHHK